MIKKFGNLCDENNKHRNYMKFLLDNMKSCLYKITKCHEQMFKRLNIMTRLMLYIINLGQSVQNHHANLDCLLR